MAQLRDLSLCAVQKYIQCQQGHAITLKHNLTPEFK